MNNHTKYKDLPNCLKCSHCEMSKFIPCRVVSGHYGFYYSIMCTNKDVVKYKDDCGNISRSFWYDPNTQNVWVDAGSKVDNDCDHYKMEYYHDVCDFEVEDLFMNGNKKIE